MIMYKILQLFVSLIFSLFLALLASFILGLKLFDTHDLGFQILYFSLLGSLIHFAAKNLHFLISLLILVLGAVALAFLLEKTSLFEQFDSRLILLFYCLLLSFSFWLIFLICWHNKSRYLKGLIFSITASFGYTIIHIIFHVFLQMPLTGSLFLAYFSNGLMLMLIVSLALNLSEITLRMMGRTFFDQ